MNKFIVYMPSLIMICVGLFGSGSDIKINGSHMLLVIGAASFYFEVVWIRIDKIEKQIKKSVFEE